VSKKKKKKIIDKIIKLSSSKRLREIISSGLSIMMSNKSIKNANFPDSSFKHLKIC